MKYIYRYIMFSLLVLTGCILFGNNIQEQSPAKETNRLEVDIHKMQELETTYFFTEQFNSNPFIHRYWKQYVIGQSTAGWLLTEDAQEGDSAFFYDDKEGYQESWLVSPQIPNLPSNCLLSFYEKNTWVPDFYGFSGVYISKGSGNPADSQYVMLYESKYPKEVYTQTILDLTDYEQDSIFIAFRYEGNHAHEWFIDDLILYNLPDFGVAIQDFSVPDIHIEKPLGLKFSIKNTGAYDLQIPGYIFIMSSNDTIYQLDFLTDKLGSLSSTEIKISDLKFNSSGDYKLIVKTKLSDVYNVTNDSVSVTFSVSNSFWNSVSSALNPQCYIISSNYISDNEDSSRLVQIADDMSIPEGDLWEIDSMIVFGTIINDIQPDSFRVIVYADKSGSPGDIIFDNHSTYKKQEYAYTLPINITLKGGRYWISVIGIFNNPIQFEDAQWNWICSPDSFGQSALILDSKHILNREDGWGILDSIHPGMTDVTFGLYGYLKPYPYLFQPPAEGHNTKLSDKTVCWFNMPVKLSNSSGIMILDDNANPLNLYGSEIKGQFRDILEIAHDPYYEGARFSVIIPEGTVKSLTSDKVNDSIVWSFETISNLPTDFTAKEEKSDQVLIYPNPSDGEFNIITRPHCQIEVFDITGKVMLIMNSSEGRNHINLTDYPDGIYFIRITSLEGSDIYHVIKD